ncbi:MULTISPECIES: hypothetical protein [unclassified Ruminococcus]|uniref:hypothetical protein n=1 Tax=unclassified Ruminococcus TaxID=2608920 RepID=UPI00210DE7EC|nr:MULTISPECIES: hypothetical protein [unclassified Ruminococcus]MCQ4021741.1 hypothetical protein [Ruminococcus sp. zg-924]MCQ4114185.1 hypothetical protein [Ruminococcus sp. zg-921]
MQRERVIENPDNADDELNGLLPEIAKLLNVSVSILERYPSDLRRLICQIYIDSYDSDDDSKRSALCQVISLNVEQLNAQTMRMQQDNVNQVAQQQNDQTLERKYILTRRTIMNNAKIISSGRRNCQEQEQGQDIIKETSN